MYILCPNNSKHRGPLLLMWFNFNPIIDISNYIHYKVVMKLLIHSQTSTMLLLKFGNKSFHLTLHWAYDYLSVLVKGAPGVIKRQACCYKRPTRIHNLSHGRKLNWSSPQAMRQRNWSHSLWHQTYYFQKTLFISFFITHILILIKHLY